MMSAGRDRSNNNILLFNQLEMNHTVLESLWISTFRYGGKIVTLYMPWCKYQHKTFKQICMSESPADYDVFQENLVKYNSDMRIDLQDRNLPYMSAIPLYLKNKYPNPCEEKVNFVYDTNGYYIFILVVVFSVFLLFIIRAARVRDKELKIMEIIVQRYNTSPQQLPTITLPAAAHQQHSTIADNKMPLSLEPLSLEPLCEEIKSPRRDGSPRNGTANKKKHRRGRK